MNSMVIANPNRCLGCYTCVAACMARHQEEGLQVYPRLQLTYTESGTMPVQCHQCEDAPCVRVCPVSAIKIKDNMVQLMETACIGCKMCALICPFGAITIGGTLPPSIDPVDQHYPFLSVLVGKKPVAVKCDLCNFSSNGPACIEACPTKALTLVTNEELERISGDKRLNAVQSMVLNNSRGGDRG